MQNPNINPVTGRPLTAEDIAYYNEHGSFPIVSGGVMSPVFGDQQSMMNLGNPYAEPQADPYAAPQADPVAQVQADPVAAAPQPEAQDWTQIAQAYGLGAPPAVGLPATMAPQQLPAAPQVQPALIDPASIPQPQPTPMPIDPRITAMSSGQGYNPDILAKMRAGAIQDTANAGQQQLGLTKRILGQNGIQGGAAAAAQGDIARQTGQAQNSALRNIDINNAQVGNENAKFGLSTETGIQTNNFNAANQLALANASSMLSTLKSNQDSQNNANQMNTGMTFQRQNDQSTMNYNNQKSQWDELNKRFGQSQNILGSWGAAA